MASMVTRLRSNLEIAFARAAGLSLGFARRFAFEVFHFMAESSKAVVEFASFDLDASLATLANKVRLRAQLKLANLDRVQMPALGAFNIDSFIFEHRNSPEVPQSIFGVEDLAQLAR